MMSAASRTPAEKDTRKMVVEIPTTVPAVRQLTVVASPGSVEIGSVGIIMENNKGFHNLPLKLIIITQSMHIPYIPTL